MHESLNKENQICFNEVYDIVTCAIAVYNAMGSGFLEAVYQEALEVELNEKAIPFEHQKHIKIYYKGVELSKGYIADLICYDKIIVELKSKDTITKSDIRQVINYLKATGNIVGVVINFGNKKCLEWNRCVFSNDTYLRKKNIPLGEKI